MIDRYTKAVLTCIAFFLGVISFQNYKSEARAQAGGNNIMKVQICDPDTERFDGPCVSVKYGAILAKNRL